MTSSQASDAAVTIDDVITTAMETILELLPGTRNTPTRATRKTLRAALEMVADAARAGGYDVGMVDGRASDGMTIEVPSRTRDALVHNVHINCSCEQVRYRGKPCWAIPVAVEKARTLLR